MFYLGTITNAGSDVKNNTNTAVPFVIPSGVTRLFVQPVDAATLMAAVGTGGSFAPAGTSMLQLGAINTVQELPIPYVLVYTGVVGGVPPTAVVAIRKTDAAAGNCKVFAG